MSEEERTAYFLAHELKMTVADLTSRMTAREYLGWIEYFSSRDKKQNLLELDGNNLVEALT